MIKKNKDLTEGAESIEISVKVNNRLLFYRVASFVQMIGNTARYKLDDGTSITVQRNPKRLTAIAAQILNR